MIQDWKQEIAIAWLVKQAMMESDTNKIFAYHLPNVAATEGEIFTAEQKLGHKLDDRYKNFLRCANGWPSFWHSTDLFGADDLIDGTRKETAEFLLSMLSEGVLKKSGVKRHELLPIAATAVDKDIFIITRPNSALPGIVLWFAGEEVERFKNFDDFFRSMVEYNRMTAKRFKGQDVNGG